MKTFQQFNEDIEQRRIQLRQRQLQAEKERVASAANYRYAQMQAEKERVASYHSAQKKKKEREELKKEIKRELKRDR
jgi:folate-dependent phosphoribosylglycinamide formyltransferase PurN